jgi:hypothetical protein
VVPDVRVKQLRRLEHDHVAAARVDVGRHLSAVGGADQLLRLRRQRVWVDVPPTLGRYTVAATLAFRGTLARARSRVLNPCLSTTLTFHHPSNVRPKSALGAHPSGIIFAPAESTSTNYPLALRSGPRVYTIKGTSSLARVW